MRHKEERRKAISIGTVMHLSKSTGQLIVKAKDEASIGDFVYTRERKRIGVVFDFFGPVNDPYIAIKPHGEDASALIGKELFVEERHRDKRR